MLSPLHISYPAAALTRRKYESNTSPANLLNIPRRKSKRSTALIKNPFSTSFIIYDFFRLFSSVFVATWLLWLKINSDIRNHNLEFDLVLFLLFYVQTNYCFLSTDFIMVPSALSRPVLFSLVPIIFGLAPATIFSFCSHCVLILFNINIRFSYYLSYVPHPSILSQCDPPGWWPFRLFCLLTNPAITALYWQTHLLNRSTSESSATIQVRRVGDYKI